MPLYDLLRERKRLRPRAAIQPFFLKRAGKRFSKKWRRVHRGHHRGHEGQQGRDKFTRYRTFVTTSLLLMAEMGVTVEEVKKGLPPAMWIDRKTMQETLQ
jgi:hypothetical protein